MKIWKKVFLAISIVLIAWITILSFLEYSYPSKEEIKLRVNYLERVITEPLDSNSEIEELGYENHEWMLFSYSFSTYAFTNIAQNDSTFNAQVVPLIKESINKVLDNKIYGNYGIEYEKLISDSIPDYSVLYLGHLNLMLGNLRLISNDTTYNRLNDRISKSLYERYRDTEFLSLESYPYSIWIPDNTVALASLKLHDMNTGSSYDSVSDDWVEYSKKHFINEETGVLYSTIDPHSGVAEEEPRGSMLGWSIMFIYQFDADYAKDLYANYKRHFSRNFGVLRLFKERHNVSTTDIGDIDSGPILAGFSIPANEFALGNAVLAEDYKTARKLQRLIRLGTSSIKEENEFRYEPRLIDFTISPMAEALVLYSSTITQWTKYN